MSLMMNLCLQRCQKKFVTVASLESCYKIRDHIKQRHAEWKVELLSTRKIGKGLHKVFKAVVNEILQYLPIFGESGSEGSYLFSEPRTFAEVTRFSDDIKKPWLKATLKEIKNIIDNQTFLVPDPQKGEPVTPYMDVYKYKIQSDGSLDKIKFRIAVRGDPRNKELVEET